MSTGTTKAQAPSRPAKPPAPKIANIPDELKSRDQWVLWKYELRGLKWTKVPFQVHQPAAKAKADVPSTWGSFALAWQLYQTGGFDGVGYEFDANDPHFGVDLDSCLEPAGVMAWAAPHVHSLTPSYGEISPSGKGLKFIARGKLPSDKGTRREGLGPLGTGALELYDHGRFFTITGDVFASSNSIADLPQVATLLYQIAKPIARTPKPQTGGNGHYVPRSGAAGVAHDDKDVFKTIARSKIVAKIRSLWMGHWHGLYTSQSQADGALCNYLAFYCGPGNHAQVERLFLKSKLAQRSKATTRNDYVPRTVDFAYAGRSDFYNWRTKLPKIEVTTERHVVRDKAIAALRKEEQLFLRGNALATVCRNSEETKKLFGGLMLRNAMGMHSVQLCSDPRMGCFLTENARLVQYHKNRKGEFEAVPCHPPAWLIAAVLAHGEYPAFRPLFTVTECSYVNMKGIGMREAVYDETIGCMLVPAFDLPPMPEKPSLQDATEAWGRLYWLIREFPWASGYDASVWLAALLTAIQRPTIAGSVPGFAFVGNRAGCGKGLAIDAIGCIVYGGPIPCCQYPNDKEEADKAALALAINGISAVHFDNLEEGSLYGNGAIDSALTCTVKSGRLLGQNRWINGVPLRPCWLLSGNNIAPGKDAFRRWLPCNLKTGLEDPHERKCETDLKRHIAEHRPTIVRDALIILKAWHHAGKPQHGLPPWEASRNGTP